MRTLSLLLLLAISLQGRLVSQATLGVPSPAFPTIQSAINAASAGDTVLVAPGTYFENVVISGPSIQVLGAGPGLSIIDGGGVGSCLKFNGPSGTVALVEGFTLQNGRGEQIFSLEPNTLVGGGVLVRSISGDPVQTVRNCEITNCSASHGSAVGVHQVFNTTLENVEIHACSVGTGTNSLPLAVISLAAGDDVLTMKDCRVHSNVADHIIVAGSSLVADGCLIDQNTALDGAIIYSDGDFPSIRRSRILNNSVGNLGVLVHVVAQDFDLGDCLIADNTGGVFAVSAISSGSEGIHNLTVANNQLGTSPFCVVYTGPNNGMANMVIWGNTDSTGAVAPPHLAGPSLYTGLVRDSIIELGTNLGPTVQSLDPLFVDVANGDYRLLPGSPAIDTGTIAISTSVYPTMPAVDLDGSPRPRGGGVDMGCHEAQSIATSPAAAGRVGENAGGPYDLLLINGSVGGDFRTVTVPVGTASVVSMLQPPHVAGPVQFSIFGLLGRAELEHVYNVPLGVGDMCFAPAPLFPTFQAFLFTYASTVGPLNGVLPFLPAYPTPWSSGFGPGIPFPVTFTFQAVIEESPGTFVPTNVIVFEVL